MPTRSKQINRYSPLYYKTFESASLGLPTILEFKTNTQAATWRQSFYSFRKALLLSPEPEHQMLYERYNQINIKTHGYKLTFYINTFSPSTKDLTTEQELLAQLPLSEPPAPQEPLEPMELSDQESILAGLGYSATQNLKPPE